MATDNVQMAEYNQFRINVANDLAKQPLKDNPNVKYGDLLSDAELEALALQYNPELKAQAINIFGLDSVNQYVNSVDFENRVGIYNRRPIEWSAEVFFPEFTERQNIYNSEEAKLIRQNEALGIFVPYNPLDQNEIDKRIEPTLLGADDTGFGLAPAAKSKVLASLGFNPQIEYRFSDTKEGRRFLFDRALNPRSMTTNDYKFLADKYGINAEFAYASPNNPNLGVIIKPEGQDWQILNSPGVSEEDLFNFIIQEVPALGAELYLTLYGTKKVEAGATGLKGLFRASDERIVGKGKKILGLSALAAAGATGGDFVRLSVGNALGSHDRDFDDIMKESGLIGAITFGGTAVINTAAQVIPKIWKMITGKDVPDNYFEKIDDLYKENRAREKGGPSGGIDYNASDRAEIDEGIAELARLMQVDLAQYNPTLSGRSQTIEAADLETIFLKYAENDELKKTYIAIKEGNVEVINKLIQAVSGKLTNTTAADLAEGLSGLAQKDFDFIAGEMETMLNKVTSSMPVGGAVESTGNILLKEVYDPNASTPAFERTTTYLNKLRNEYMDEANINMQNALNNPIYDNIVTGAGFLRGPANKWVAATKGKTDKLFASFGDKDAKKVLDELLGTQGGETLRRIRGYGKKGGYANAEELGFTLNELHNARVALNDFASRYADKFPKATRLARDLERGFELQIDALLDEGVSQSLIKQGVVKPTKAQIKAERRRTGFGDDLILAWSAQKRAIQDSYSDIVQQVLRTEPESVAQYILSTNSKFATTNSKLEPLMRILKEGGEDEVYQVQLGVARYLEKQFFEDTTKSTLQRASDYRKFVKENEGTLKLIFGDDDKSLFLNPKKFIKEIIEPLENRNRDLLKLTSRFGVSNVGNPETRAFNIVTNLLNASKTQKESGILLDDIKYFSDLVADNPALKEQMSEVVKKYILQQVLKPTGRRGEQFTFDAFALNDLLYKGFGPEDMVGEKLTFDNFFRPLLGGDEAADEYVKNLKLVNEMILREVGQAPSPSVVNQVMGGEYKAGGNLENARFLQRMLIAPLTILGRRITALTNSQVQRSRKHIGFMLTDKKYYDAYKKFYEGQISYDRMVNIMSGYGMVVYQDLGTEKGNYDIYQKVLLLPEDDEEYQNIIRRNAIINPAMDVVAGGVY
jgi:hypothetical protein